MVNSRRPGQSKEVSPRKENDLVEFLSGFSPDSVTLGTPIGFIVRNQDTRSSDYEALKGKFRPNHADYTYLKKYGIHDFRGGGRSSARDTVSRVVGGAIASQIIAKIGIKIDACLSRVGKTELTNPYDILMSGKKAFDSFPCPDKDIAEAMRREIMNAAKEHDSIGGTVSCVITGAPVGLGEPLAHKLHALLAESMLSINAAKGFEYGDGFKSAMQLGSEAMDCFNSDNNGNITLTSNHSGGIQGGISNGMPITFSVAFKPTPTIFRTIKTIDSNGEPTELTMTGRHDPCVAVRAVPVVKACAAMVMVDALIAANKYGTFNESVL
jgi:chorismate synthase